MCEARWMHWGRFKHGIVWIIWSVYNVAHSCINTRGMMYDSSVLVWSNEWLTGNHGDWLQAPFVKNLAPWPPTNRWTYCCPKMTLFKTTLSYIKMNMPIFCYSHFKSVNLTCVWMGLRFSGVHHKGLFLRVVWTGTATWTSPPISHSHTYSAGC